MKGNSKRISCNSLSPYQRCYVGSRVRSVNYACQDHVPLLFLAPRSRPPSWYRWCTLPPPPTHPPLQSLLGLLKRVSSNNGMIVMSRTWNKERNLQSLTGFKPSLLLWPPQYNAGALFSSLRFWETGKPLRFLASKCVIWLWAQLKVEWLSVSTHPVVNIFVLVLQVHWWDDSWGALRFS